MRQGSIAIIAAIRKAAQAGERCPSNADLQDAYFNAGGADYAAGLRELTGSGKLRIEIAGKNWRIATLPAEGLSTAAEPHGAPAWRRIDEHGTRRLGL